MDVGQHTTSGNGHTAKQLVELLVIADGELQVAWDDPLALVITSSVSGKLKNFSAQVLEHGGHVHGSTSAETGGKALLAHVATDTADRELKSGTGRAGGRLGSLGAGRTAFASFSCCLSWHVDEMYVAKKIMTSTSRAKHFKFDERTAPPGFYSSMKISAFLLVDVK